MSADKTYNLILKGVCLSLQFVSSSFDLTAVQHVLKKPVIQVNGCQLLQFCTKSIAKLIYNESQEIFDELQIVNEYLKKVFDSNFLVRFKLELLKSFTLESSFMLRVLNQSLSNFLYNLEDSLRLISFL